MPERHDSPRADESPQGGVQENFSPNDQQNDPEKSNGVHRKKVKVAGRVVSQPIRPKLNFISMRQGVKRANKSDLPMFLFLVQPTEPPMQKIGKSKAKTGTTKG